MKSSFPSIMKVYLTAAAMSICVVSLGSIDSFAKSKPETPGQSNANIPAQNTNSTKKPGSACDKSKQATEDYKACIDAAAKTTQNQGKSKKQGN